MFYFLPLACPAAVTSTTDFGVCSATVSYNAPVVQDNCGATFTLSAGLPSLSSFPLGVTQNSFTALDAAGLTASCLTTVTVNDAQAPTVGMFSCSARKLLTFYAILVS